MPPLLDELELLELEEELELLEFDELLEELDELELLELEDELLELEELLELLEEELPLPVPQIAPFTVGVSTAPPLRLPTKPNSTD